MDPLSSRQIARLDRALRALYVHANSDAFPARLLESVRGLVASEVTCYTEVDRAGARVRNVADPASDALDAMIPLLADLQGQHPRIADFQTTGEMHALTISDYLSRTEWHRRDLFQHFYGPLGLEDQISIMMPAQPDVLIGLALNRANRSFDSADRALLDILQPHVAQAWLNARAVSELERPRPESGESESATVVRLREDGTVLYATRRGRDVLNRYFRERRPTAELPQRLRLRLRGRLVASAEDVLRPQHHVRRVRGPHGELELRLVRCPAVEGWLLIARERRPDVHELPRRLRRVLDRLLLGESEKSVAAYLRLSPHTVHEYTKQIYARFGVSSRSELLARWIPVRDE